jgi:dipeptidase E
MAISPRQFRRGGGARWQDVRMRMLLTSGGVRNDLICESVLELLGKPFEESMVAVIIDAILPFAGGNTKTLADLSKFHDLGWKQFDLMSLAGGPHSVIEARLRSADVIFCYGGTNHWLAHAWTSNGFAPLLQELLETKVYIGLSAGSMIFSRLHTNVVEAFDDQEEVAMLQLDSVAPALPLFDWAVMCHLGAPYFPETTDDWAAEHAARLAHPIYFIDDDTALLVRDPEDAPEVVSEGHWLQFDGGARLVASR